MDRLMPYTQLFRKNLIDWYNINKRDLPWRDTKDPYAIWLSEVMLQQTTVSTVIPYYKKFLKKFPTIYSVCEASEDDLLNAWSGLGYYKRIRQFQKASFIIVNNRNGEIPNSREELKKLPGVGEYISSAVASIAFGEKVSVVDGNVIRVLARLFAYKNDISATSARNFFRAKADKLLDQKKPGDFNQAMMELGAMVCTPGKPHCPVCPVKEFCRAQKNDNPEFFPVKEKKINYRKEVMNHIIVAYRDRVLLRRRKPNETLSGFWELPDGAGFSKLKKSGFPLPPVCHAIMNRRITVNSCYVEIDHLSFSPPKDCQWVSLKRLDHFPLTTVTRKVFAMADFSF